MGHHSSEQDGRGDAEAVPPYAREAIPYAMPGALERPRTDWFSVTAFVFGITAIPAAAGVRVLAETYGALSDPRMLPLLAFGAGVGMVAGALAFGWVGRRRVARSAGQLKGETWGLIGIGLGLGYVVVAGLAVLMMLGWM
jgi:hypothetical protein